MTTIKLKTSDPNLIRLIVEIETWQTLGREFRRVGMNRGYNASSGQHQFEADFLELTVAVREPESDTSYRDRILAEHDRRYDAEIGLDTLRNTARYGIKVAAEAVLDEIGAAYGVERR